MLLYELLTGATPFDKERLGKAAYDEIRRIIREEEPPRPSMRVSTLGGTATAVSEHRKTEPKKLSALLKGDLDWIVMKALEKDRTRRYATAKEFADDIQHYLHRPASGGPGTVDSVPIPEVRAPVPGGYRHDCGGRCHSRCGNCVQFVDGGSGTKCSSAAAGSG